VIFFDIDTQNDFMKPDGALYVPEAETICGQPWQTCSRRREGWM
jgi:nicotinamidase-related amidase